MKISAWLVSAAAFVGTLGSVQAGNRGLLEPIRFDPRNNVTWRLGIAREVLELSDEQKADRACEYVRDLMQSLSTQEIKLSGECTSHRVGVNLFDVLGNQFEGARVRDLKLTLDMGSGPEQGVVQSLRSKSVQLATLTLSKETECLRMQDFFATMTKKSRVLRAQTQCEGEVLSVELLSK
jgi:hypothetical protein